MQGEGSLRKGYDVCQNCRCRHRETRPAGVFQSVSNPACSAAARASSLEKTPLREMVTVHSSRVWPGLGGGLGAGSEKYQWRVA